MRWPRRVLSPINSALLKLSRRAESVVDQGKTHALTYLGAKAAEAGDVAAVIDSRTVGSTGGLSTTEGREPNAQVAHGEAVQVPGAATRDLLGLGSEKPGELPLEAQPRVLLDDALADCIGYLVAA